MNCLDYPGRGFELSGLPWEGGRVAWIILGGGLSSLDHPGRWFELPGLPREGFELPGLPWEGV